MQKICVSIILIWDISYLLYSQQVNTAVLLPLIGNSPWTLVLHCLPVFDNLGFCLSWLSVQCEQKLKAAELRTGELSEINLQQEQELILSTTRILHLEEQLHIANCKSCLSLFKLPTISQLPAQASSKSEFGHAWVSEKELHGLLQLWVLSNKVCFANSYLKEDFSGREKFWKQSCFGYINVCQTLNWSRVLQCKILTRLFSWFPWGQMRDMQEHVMVETDFYLVVKRPCWLLLTDIKGTVAFLTILTNYPLYSTQDFLKKLQHRKRNYYKEKGIITRRDSS